MNPANSTRNSQRGEGKVGCTVSFLVLVILAAIAIKVFPVYYANNQITDIVERKAEMAAGRKAEDMVKEIRAEVQDAGIPEAYQEGAITMTKTGEHVRVTIRYTHKVDLYGITEWPITVDKSVDRVVMEGIR